MTNIEKFDFYSAKILAFLLDEFPVEKDISILKDIIKDSNATSDEKDFIYHTFKTLKEYGFITFESANIGEDFIYDCKLSLKALEVLKAMPKSLKINKSIGEKLKDSIALADKEAIKQSVGFVFSYGSKLISF